MLVLELAPQIAMRSSAVDTGAARSIARREICTHTHTRDVSKGGQRRSRSRLLPPPWTMKSLMMRWNLEPLKWSGMVERGPMPCD